MIIYKYKPTHRTSDTKCFESAALIVECIRVTF